MTRRERRRQTYKEAGFLPFEYKELLNIPLYVPYVRSMISRRRREYNKAIKRGTTKTAYINSIRTDYERYNWIDKYGKASPYAMLRWYEDWWWKNAPNRSKDAYRKIQMKNQLGKRLIKGNIRAQKARYREAHADDILKQKKKYRQTHKEQIREYKREYRLNKRGER